LAYDELSLVKVYEKRETNVSF